MEGKKAARRETKESGKSKSVPMIKPPKSPIKGARVKTTIFSEKLPYMNIMRTQIIMENLMGKATKEITPTSSPPVSKKVSTTDFTSFINRNRKISKFEIIGQELIYNSEEEFGVDDAIMQEHIHGTLLNRVEGIEGGVIKALQKFESEIIRIKRRLKKIVHIVNILLV